MNLIQLQEQLKDMPMQAVQAYMNGSNPQVPPYLAAAELQRRQAAMKSQQAQQGAAQGPQTSIKEQLEQATGLMGLQAQRAQQGMQQVAQQAQQAPMPATEGTPQPEMQPEPEVQMAQGGRVKKPSGCGCGISNLPVRDSMFRDGGVVGYADGGATMSPAPGALEALLKKREDLRKLGMDTTKLDQQIAAMQGTAPGASQGIPDMTSEAMYPQVMQQVLAETPDPTEEQQIASMRKLEEGAGMPDYVKRLQGLEEKYAKSTEGRGLETLMRTLAGGSSGPGGWAQGYLGAQEANRAADMEHAKELASAYGGLSKDRFGALTQGLGKERENTARMRQEKLQTLGRVFGDVGERERAEISAAAQRDVMQGYTQAKAASTASADRNTRLQMTAVGKELTSVEAELRRLAAKTIKSPEDEKREAYLQNTVLPALRARLKQFQGSAAPTEGIAGLSGSMGAPADGSSSGREVIDFTKVPFKK